METPNSDGLIHNASIREAHEKIQKLELEIAERRPVAEVVRYVAYFFAAIGILLGVLGYNELSDLKSEVIDDLRPNIASEVENQISEDMVKLEAAQRFVDTMDSNSTKVDELMESFASRISELQRVELAAETSDVRAQFGRIAAEIEYRISNSPDLSNESDPYKGTTLEEAWRIGVVDRVNRMIADEEISKLTADELFNVVQDMRRMGANDLAGNVLNSIPIDPEKPANEALRYATIAGTSTGKQRDEAFNSLLNLLNDLDERSPHIVLSEVFNAAEDLRRYSELIDALKKAEVVAITEDRQLTSSFYAILSWTYTRRGFAGDPIAARINLEKAISLIGKESSISQWYPSTNSRISQLNRILR